MSRRKSSKYSIELILYLFGAMLLFYALILGKFLDTFPYLIPGGLLSIVAGFIVTVLRLSITNGEKDEEAEYKAETIKTPDLTSPQAHTIPRLLFFTEKLPDDLSKDVIYKLKARSLERTSTTYKESSTCEYSMQSFSFDPDTRNASIVFVKTTKYRTIVRYVQENYEKYPVYSDWKTKQKTIKKSIKLTNSTLENLCYYADDSDGIIRRFADLIILKLGKQEYFPSWIIKKWLKFELDADTNELKGDFNSSVMASLKRSEEIKNQKTKLERNKTIKEKEKTIAEEKSEKYRRSMEKAVFLKKYKTKAYEKWRLLQEEASARLEKLGKEIEKAEDHLKNEKEHRIQVENQNKNSIDYATRKYDLLYKKVQSLPDDVFIISKKDAFSPLKVLSGMEYSKIIGVYVIRNTENGKCYVGQSKDIIRRLRQHFHGTTPNNVIFAEDYYSSKMTDKTDLFEFKIIPLETKDELDETERKLIKKYNSREEGYNKTQGNT